MQAVAGLSGEAHHLGSLRHQDTVVTNLVRRDPDLWQQPGGMQPGQGSGGNLVGHDLGASDERHVGRMHNRDRLNVRQQLVVELEGVGRHLQDHGVLAGEVLAHPVV